MDKTIRTLIVEDDQKIAEIQQVFVEKIDGFEVVGVSHSIAEGLDMLNILQPELVLLDIYFPDGNGLDVLWKIRHHHKKTDIVLVTAAKESSVFQEAIRGGVFDYILKPLVFNRFSSTLKRYAEHRKNLDSIEVFNQQKVDMFLRQEKTPAFEKDDLPKGIDSITLKKIIEVVQSLGEDGINAENAGSRVGVSRTTSRRYLEYLVSAGVVLADNFYGTPGRPERIYRQV